MYLFQLCVHMYIYDPVFWNACGSRIQPLILVFDLHSFKLT